MIGTLLSMLIFVTDCDNTLVHYDSSEKHNGVSTIKTLIPNGEDYLNQELITMPASSGSGKVASISTLTVETLKRIAAEGVDIICATGMRASTMLQRESFFPSITYWACENGGRIFYRANEGETPTEIMEYSEMFAANTKSQTDLASFSETLRSEGWEVDSKGYLTMVRVKGDNLESIIARIPDTLSHTFNLGYLDIQYPGCGKLSAARWIIRNRLMRSHPNVSSESVSLGLQSPSGELSSDLPFLFMGDDDNDIEIAGAAEFAFITKPCSSAMQSFIDRYNSEKAAGNDIGRGVKEIQEAPFLRHRGTEAMLQKVLETIQSAKSSQAPSEEL